MAAHFLKVPVEFGYMEISGVQHVGAFLRLGNARVTTIVGYGSTEDEAFTDLKRKLGLAEVP